jgi:hypothetical protein
MEQVEQDVKKEIGKICRTFLEISLESYKCFTAVNSYLTTRGSKNSKSFAADPQGLLGWLKSISKFSRAVKNHIREGRMRLLSYLAEEECFNNINELHKQKLETKSQLVSELDIMVQGVLDLSLVKTLDKEDWVGKTKSR